MSFKVGMPESGSTLGNTRKLFVNELFGMRTTAAKNHVDQNEIDPNPLQPGKHTFCHFTNVNAGTTLVTELALYNKKTSGKQRFFIRQPLSGTEIQISGVDPTISGHAGCTFLPGGLLLQWGGTTLTKHSVKTLPYAKQGSDGFVYLQTLALSLEKTKLTSFIGYDFVGVNQNDGIRLSITNLPTEGEQRVNYLVIGTMV